MDESTYTYPKQLLETLTHAINHELKNALSLVSNELHILSVNNPCPEYEHMLRRIKQTTQLMPAINLDVPLSAAEAAKLKATKIELDSVLSAIPNARGPQILKLCLLIQELLCDVDSELVIGSALNQSCLHLFFDLPSTFGESLMGCRNFLEFGQRVGGKKAIQAARIDAEIYARCGRVSISGSSPFRLQLEFPIEAL